MLLLAHGTPGMSASKQHNCEELALFPCISRAEVAFSLLMATLCSTGWDCSTPTPSTNRYISVLDVLASALRRLRN